MPIQAQSWSNDSSILPPLQADVDILHSFYNATNGDDWWYNKANPWNFSQPQPNPCSERWMGIECEVTCNATACWEEVQALALKYCALAGTLPADLGNLSALRLLRIENNPGLYGSFPESLGYLTTLQEMSFESVSLSGSLPHTIARLQNLEKLSLNSMPWSSTIPEELYSLTKLVYLSFDMSGVHGTISHAIGNLTNLQVFSSMANTMQGSLPESLGELKTLREINLKANQLTGSIPSLLFYNNRELLLVYLDSNYFSGPLPRQWAFNSTLQDLQIDLNIISGSISDEFFSLSRLCYLTAEQNVISGTLPSNASAMVSLAGLDLGQNYLTGTIPSSFGSLPKLGTIYLNSNSFNGTVPPELANISALISLSVADSLLTGTIPSGFGLLPLFDTLDLSYNFLDGTIPDDLFQSQLLIEILLSDNLISGTLSQQVNGLHTLHYFALDYNLLYGKVSNFSETSHMERLSLGNNFFTGKFEVDLSSMASLIMLQVQSCLFTGRLDFTLPSFSYLEFLNVSSNFFTGHISFLSEAREMMAFDVSNNMLTGTLPDIFDMGYLQLFFVRSNFLEGSIEELFSFGINQYLRNIDLSSNQLTGSMPNDLHFVTTGNSLASFAAIQNCFTGTIPESFCNLTSLQVLALDGLSTAKACCRSTLSSLLPQVHSYTLGNHAIHGSIPKCLFSMPKLRTLHLSGNGLEGSIPVEEEQELGASLSDLSLSHNQLTGSLPPPLRGGSRWVNLDVSYNKLKGELQLESGGESGDASAWTNSSSTSNSNSDSNSSAGSSSGFSTNASIYLNINRLSGRIPGFYYDIGGAGGELNMLEGNMFACPETGLSSDVPSADPYRLQYGCGSDNLNSALFAWAGLSLFIFGFVSLFIYFARKEKSVVSSVVDGNRKPVEDDISGGVHSHDDRLFLRSHEPSNELHAPSWYPFRVCCTALQHNFLFLQLANWCDDLILWQRADWQMLASTPSACMRIVTRWDCIWIAIANQIEPRRASSKCAIVDIFVSGKLLGSIRRYVFWLMVCMICLGGPIYGSLTVFYGSYSHEYAWTLSAGYLSGIGASCVLLVYFMVLIGLVSTRYLDGSRGVSRRQQQQQHTHGQDSSTEGEECTVNVLHAQERVTSQSERSAISSLPSGSGSDSITERKKLDWRAVLLVKVCIAVVNISIVLVVNGFYVYIYLQIERWSAMMLSVALSLFKVYWSMLVQLGIVHLLQPLQQQRKTNEKAWSLHEENVGFMSSLMLFNTIVAPCLATMIASSDCFYYVFASPKTIKASYTFEQCEVFSSLGCDSFSSATHSFDFAPPFSYNYQCSSAVLVGYAYVFAYKYILIGILYPLFILSVVLHGEWMRSGRGAADEKRQSSYAMESLLPLLWRIQEIKHETASTLAVAQKGRHGIEAGSIVSVDSVTNLPAPGQGIAGTADVQGRIPSVSSFLSRSSSSVAIAFSSLSISRSYFSSGDYVVRVTMMLGCLLTFGAVLPYLAILIAFSIASNTYLTQVGWLRVLERWVSSKRRKTEKTSAIDMSATQADGDSGESVDDKNEVDSECVEERKRNDEHDIEALPASSAVTMTTRICQKDQSEDEDDDDEGEQRQEREGTEKRLEKDKEKDEVEDKMLLEIGEECGRMEQSFDRATRPLFLLLPFFYACYLFDTSGDEAGGWVGFYFVIAWFSVCSVLLLWRRYSYLLSVVREGCIGMIVKSITVLHVLCFANRGECTSKSTVEKDVELSNDSTS
eukprot:scaffold642_cov166-Ochromonas_danica.AAC.19